MMVEGKERMRVNMNFSYRYESNELGADLFKNRDPKYRRIKTHLPVDFYREALQESDAKVINVKCYTLLILFRKGNTVQLQPIFTARCKRMLY